MFKPGDKVICIDINNLSKSSLLKLNHMYIVDLYWKDYIGIDTEEGYFEYLDTRFISLKEYRKQKLLKIQG